MADGGSIVIKITGDDSQLQSVLSGIGQKANGVGDVFKGMMASQIVTKGFDLLVSGIRQSIETGMEFEAQMSRVAAISGATGSEIQMLTDTAKHYGETTKFTARQAAEALEYMALAGWSATQSADALPGVLNLAAASGMDLGRASDAVTDYLSAFGMEAKQATYMADLMAYAQSNANTSAMQLSEAYGNCASSMHAAGQDIETTTAMLMALANNGIKGSQVGTQMAAVMRDLTQKMEDGKIQIGDTSVAVTDAKGNFRDLNDIIADVGKATEGLGTAEAAAAIMDTFTARSVKAIQTILNEGIDNVNAYEDALRGSEGTAAQQAEVMMDNLKGDIQIFQSALEGVQITASEAMNDSARSIVQKGTDLLAILNQAGKNGGIKGMVKAFISEIPALTGDLLNGITRMFSGDMVPSLIEGLTGAMGGAIEGLITNLPQLIPALATGFVNVFDSALNGAGNLLGGIFNGIENVLKKQGLMDYDLSDRIHMAFEGADTSGIQVGDIELPEITLDGEVNVEEYRNKIEEARQAIQDLVESFGLEDNEAQNLEEALMKGSGADALNAAMQALDIPEEQINEVTGKIGKFRESMQQVFSDFKIDDPNGKIQENIADFVAKGGSLQEAFEQFANLSAEDAATAAKELQPKLDEAVAAIQDLNLPEIQLSDLQEKISSFTTSLSDVLSGFNIEDPTGKIKEQIIEFTTQGGDLETALQNFANLSAEDAKAAAAKIQPQLDEMMGTLGELNIPEDQIASVAEKVSAFSESLKGALAEFKIEDTNGEIAAQISAAVAQGESLESAFQQFANLSAEDAKTAAENLQQPLTDMMTALESLEIPEIDTSKITEAVIKADGDIALALGMLGASDGQISQALANIETLKNSISEQLRGVFDSLKEAFTDGIAENDAAAAEQGLEAVNNLADQGKQKIGEWLDSYVQQLKDMNLDAEAYATKLGEAQQIAQQMQTDLDSAIQGITGWINENAGAATSAVKANLDQLDSFISSVEEIEARIDQLNGQLDMKGFATRSAVQAGQMGSQNAQATAMGVTATEYERAVASAWEAYTKAEKEANDAVLEARKERAKAVTEAEKAAADEKIRIAESERGVAEALRDQQIREAGEVYNANMQAVAQGMIKSDGDLARALDGIKADAAIRNAAGKLPEAVQAEFWNAQQNGIKPPAAEEVLAGLGLDDAGIAQIAEAVGMQKEAFLNSINSALNETGTIEGAESLREFAESAEQMTADAVEGLDITRMAEVFKKAYDEGFLKSVEGYDWTDPEAAMKQALMDYVNGVEPEPVKAEPQMEVDPEVTVSDDTGDKIAEAMEETVGTADGGEQTEVNPEITVAPEVTASEETGESVAEAVGEAMSGAEGAEEQTIEATANVNLTIGEVTVSEDTEIGALLSEQFSEESLELSVSANIKITNPTIDTGAITSAASSAVSSAVSAASGVASSGGNSVGSALSAGIAAGITAGMGAVIAAAVAVVQAAIAAAKAAAGIASPSRAMAELGKFYDLGLAQGITENTRTVVDSALDMSRKTLGAVNLSPGMDFSGLTGGMNSDAGGIADIESAMDVVLNVNGRELARTTASDYNSALNGYARYINMGYGRG